MSPRDIFWFLAGSLVAFMVLFAARAWLQPASSETTGTATIAANSNATLLMPGDQWPTAAEAAATGTGRAAPTTAKSGNAGSMDEVTGKLAKRLAVNGGTADEWRLLAESYEYMGRTDEARAARMHATAR